MQTVNPSGSAGSSAAGSDPASYGLSYEGSFVYSLDGYGNRTLESIAFDEGRILAGGSSYVADYHIKDHLGNVRAVVRNGSTIERNDYYPYGTRMAKSGLISQTSPVPNRYLFSSKEDQAVAFGSYGLDFGARDYDHGGLTWLEPDPLASKYHHLSPYVYCADNPLKFVDPDGREVEPKGENELNVIKNTLPEDARCFVILNDCGYIDGNLLSQYTGSSANYQRLLFLVKSKDVVSFSLASEFDYVTQYGFREADGRLTYFEPDTFFSDTHFEFVSGLTTGESGNYGKTLFPDLDGVQNSTTSGIQIFVHPSLSKVGQAEAFSHEAYGHALLYIVNNHNHHCASHMCIGTRDCNIILTLLILESRKDTVNNISK